MSIEENKAVIRRYYEAFWNAGDLNIADELLHPTLYVDRGSAAGAQSVEAVKEHNTIWHRILPGEIIA